MSNTEQLHFQVQSPQNIIRYATTILFERNKDDLSRLGNAWHKILDTDEGEDLFLSFAEKVMPEGGIIELQQLEKIKDLAIHYLETDEAALECQAEYDKQRFGSWVYFKPYHKVYPVGFVQHVEKVKELLIEYFKGAEEYDYDAFRRFLRENFEICSENTDIDDIVNDAAFLHRCATFGV